MDNDQFAEAIAIVEAFRALHAGPLKAATMGLRSAVTSEGLTLQVSQRLKRVPTLIGKLQREPTLALSRMQDIGGCRAVVPSVRDIRVVQRRLAERPSRARRFVSLTDYIENPRDSGYRGVHVIEQYGGRNIEMQLRTPVMHEWSMMVELLAVRYDDDIKGSWQPEVSPFLAIVSEAMAIEESGMPVPTALLREVERQRLQFGSNPGWRV